MATTLTKLFPDGVLQSSAEFDEVNFSGVIKVGPSGVVAKEFNEITLSTSTAERRLSDGTYLVSGYFDDYSLSIRAPGAPIINSVTVLSTSSVSVAFSAPADPGTSPITSYMATSTPDSVTATAPASPITVTRLTASRSYRFAVRAMSLAGTSPDSALSSQVTTPALPAPSFQYWLVGGGGGAGSSIPAGGGGGGGFVVDTATGIAVVVGRTYTITVGAGSAANTNGIASSIIATGVSVTANGGGKGAITTAAAGAGGSGGGGCGYNIAYNSGGTGGQGSNGGSGYNSGSTPSGGGGGGAGGAGSPGTSGKGGNGGIGKAAWGAVGGFGYYAAGGGGSASGAFANQGLNAPYYSAIGAGYEQSGQGGGAFGQKGGSGIVTIRFPVAYADPASTTGSPIASNDGTYKIYQWTGSGSITF